MRTYIQMEERTNRQNARQWNYKKAIRI
jgi:hypothetical protein